MVYYFFILLLCASCSREAQKTAERLYPVTVTEVKIHENVPIFLENIGNIYSREIIYLRPQVSGVIKKTYFEEGSYVKKDDPLFLIDPRPYEAALERAEAALIRDQSTLDFANIRLERYDGLVKKEYFSKLNYEQYKAEADAAKGQVLIDKAEIATAKLNLEWALLKSPIDGKISSAGFDTGNLVAANDPTPLTIIRQISPIDVFFYFGQTDYVTIRNAMSKQKEPLKVHVFLPQEPGKIREAEVYFVDNQVNL